MTRNKEIEILCDALHKFGTKHQVDKTIEELAELQKALLKYRADNTKQNHFNIVDEIVDCEIMIEQMKIVFCDEKLIGFNSYEEQKEFKLNRLKERISNHAK